MNTFDVQRGETRRWLLFTPVGTDLDGWSAAAAARPWNARTRKVEPASSSVALGVTSFEGDSARGPGFYLTLTPVQTAALAGSYYQVDAQITLPTGDVEITDAWILKMIEPAVGA